MVIRRDNSTKQSHIWILGNFYLPDMNWSNKSPSYTCRFKELYATFTENMINLIFEQMVNIPTRNNIIRDLFLTNILSQVYETKTLPVWSTSDHDIVFYELNVKRGRIKQTLRQVRSYKKANWSDLKKYIALFTYMFTTHKYPNHLWDMFKAEVNRLSTLHTSTRQIKSRADLQWVTHEIVKLIKKRQTVYTTEKFKHLKSTIQKQIRNAYWSYLESVIFSDTQGPGHKREFYNFVKHN